VCRVVRARVHGAHRRRGTEGSNPAPSSGESYKTDHSNRFRRLRLLVHAATGSAGGC